MKNKNAVILFVLSVQNAVNLILEDTKAKHSLSLEKKPWTFRKENQNPRILKKQTEREISIFPLFLFLA